MSSLNVPNIIIKKSSKKELTAEEIEFFVKSAVCGNADDAQIGAWLMAVYLNGMTVPETVQLTKAMKESGEQLEWPESWKGNVVDKHSTGGVGDKISPILVPLLATFGFKMPKISGRGLGFTGGTVDKLESIPGFITELSTKQIKDIVEEIGCVIAGQTRSLVPADKILYATRDRTGTIASLPLIASSIVSKKAAENLDVLVLDVKYGRAAFMKTKEEAQSLGDLMVDVSEGMGTKTVAVISEMEQPVGRYIGNALEIKECLDTLNGNGPQDLVDIVTELGANVLVKSGKCQSIEEGTNLILDKLKNGSGIKKFAQMMKAQGVDEQTVEKLIDKETDVFQILPKAKFQEKLTTDETGKVTDINARELAEVCSELGAGRMKAGMKINPSVGMVLFVKKGDTLEKNQPWIEVHHDREDGLSDEHIHRLQSAIKVDNQSEPRKKAA